VLNFYNNPPHSGRGQLPEGVERVSDAELQRHKNPATCSCWRRCAAVWRRSSLLLRVRRVGDWRRRYDYEQSRTARQRGTPARPRPTSRGAAIGLRFCAAWPGRALLGPSAPTSKRANRRPINPLRQLKEGGNRDPRSIQGEEGEPAEADERGAAAQKENRRPGTEAAPAPTRSNSAEHLPHTREAKWEERSQTLAGHNCFDSSA